MRTLTNKNHLESLILDQLLELSYEPPTLQNQIQALMKATKKSMQLKTKKQMKDIIIDVEAINKQLDAMKPKKDIELIGNLKTDIEAMNENLKKNQEMIDKFIYEQHREDFTNNFPIVKP